MARLARCDEGAETGRRRAMTENRRRIPYAPAPISIVKRHRPGGNERPDISCSAGVSLHSEERGIQRIRHLPKSSGRVLVHVRLQRPTGRILDVKHEGLEQELKPQDER